LTDQCAFKHLFFCAAAAVDVHIFLRQKLIHIRLLPDCLLCCCCCCRCAHSSWISALPQQASTCT
jgi:hypothetical protein